MIWRQRARATILIQLLFPFTVFAQTANFFNVLEPNGADPWVFRHSDGYYYITASKGGGVMLQRSQSLSGLGAGEKKVVWRPPSSGPFSKELWAPEMHHLNGKWYIYVAADDGQNENHRMYAIENESEDPFEGEFVMKGKVFDPHADKWAIDATVLNLNGRLYFIWSGLEAEENVKAILYIAPMSNPFTLTGPRIEISRPQFDWEKTGSEQRTPLPEVNEGPEVLIRNDAVHIVYSAGGSWTDDYCLGILTAKSNDDLLQPTSWKKSKQPVFHRGNGVRGPGHCSFVKSPNGKEDWIVYHAARFEGAGWDRLIRTQPFYWDKNGLPRFGEPAPPNELIRLPKGDPPHHRYEAERAKRGGTARIIERPDSSGMAKVGYIDTPQSSVEFTVTAKTESKHVISVRFGNGTERKRVSSHKVTINETFVAELSYPNSGWDNWSNAFMTAELKKGKNTIRFSKGDDFAEIDCIDVFPNDK
ncbi:MAG TPA: family 43 glycosylhydrolase [Planctomycetaceae bacterium]|nr:family 43 glycosylhydrolase [Planctomycetaceae bacterium]